MLSTKPSPTGSEQELEIPSISMIIPSRNRPHVSLDTVDSVLRGDEVSTELIIVDQSDAPHPSLKSFTTERLRRSLPLVTFGWPKPSDERGNSRSKV
jgi:hypothetical protein